MGIELYMYALISHYLLIRLHLRQWLARKPLLPAITFSHISCPKLIYRMLMSQLIDAHTISILCMQFFQAVKHYITTKC